MNYSAIYEALVSRAAGRVLEGYTESHHIIPTCMGGTNAPENLVRLTAEEHFLAHKLLVKMHPGHRCLVFALQAMSMDRDGVRLNNKLFGWARRLVAAAVGDMKRGVPRSAETIRKITVANSGRVRPAEESAKTAAALRGKPKSPEHIAKVAAALTGRKGGGTTGRTHSPETIEKMRAKALGRKHTPETMAKMAATAQSHSKEWRSEQAHKAWATKRAKLAATG